MSDHALLSASHSSTWMNCYGALFLSKDAPNESSAYADEGSAAHTLASRCLVEPFPAPHDFKGERIDQGTRTFEVTDEMADEVAKYVQLVNDLADGGDLFVEQRVGYHGPLGVDDGKAFGTSDAIIVVGDELIVVDLKYGRGVRVDAVNNSQLMLYAVGALEEYGLVYDIKTVRMVISQPRLNHVSEDVVTVEELKEFVLLAQMAAQHSLAILARDSVKDAELTPGEKQCRWCRAKATCPALAGYVKKEIAGVATLDDFEAVVEAKGVADKPMAMQLAAVQPLTSDLDAERLAYALRAADLVEAWIKAVRSESERRLLAGLPVPGFKLVEGKRGNRAWTDAEAAEKLLKSFRLKQEEMYSFSLISPTTAEKLLKEQPKRWTKAAALIGQKPGSPHVTTENDPRPALNRNATADDFDVVPDGGDLV